MTITDPSGLSTTSTVSVTVNSALASLVVTPATPTLASHATEQFAVTGYDQFGTALTIQPTITWTATAGSINSSGLYLAPYASASATVTATSGTVSGTAVITIDNSPPTLATAAAALPSLVTGSTTALSVLGADDAGEANLIYTWSATTVPSGIAVPTFSDNGTNSAKNTTATFFGAGSYGFLVTITDMGGLSTTSSVNVTVGQTLAAYSVTPPPQNGGGADGGGSFQTTALDQFGDPLSTQPSLPYSISGNDINFNAAGGATIDLNGESLSFASVTFSTDGNAVAQQGSGGTLDLANGANSATLTVTGGSDTIAAPVDLQSNTSVLPAAGSQLIISGDISGMGSLTVDAPGTVVLAGTNSYSGGTNVLEGTLAVNTSTAISSGTSLVIGAGGTMIFDPTLSANPAQAVAATTPANAVSLAVPPSGGSRSLVVAPSGGVSQLVVPPSGGLVLPLSAPPVFPVVATTHHALVVGSIASQHSSLVSDSPITPPKGGTTSAAPPVVRSAAVERAAAQLAWLDHSTGEDTPDHGQEVSTQIRDALFAQYGAA